MGSHRFISFVLVLCVLLSSFPQAFADDAAPFVLDADEIETLFDRYIAENGLNPDIISIGYVYTATGESWFYNEDKWYYSASLYKVPLMMLYAEKEYLGELNADSEICGTTLDRLEEAVLTYSDNDLAYSALTRLADPVESRRMFQRYSDLPEEYYLWNFYSFSDFTARFMTDVMRCLYENSNRFPRVIDHLKDAHPGHFFHLFMGENDLVIAQKYGSYHDEDGNDWNHTAGIVYTPNPFILTVMTRYGGISENIIGDLALLFRDYTLAADQKLQELKD